MIPTNNVFHKLINPKRNVPEEAIKIHGFSEEFLKTKQTFSEIADDFLSFIDGKKIIIHNANFDLGFLNGELAAVNKKQINKNMVIDSLDIARNKFPGTSNSLDALCKRFNIDLSRRTKHNALLDCELLREAYINLLDVKEPKLHLSSSSDSIDKFSNFKDSYSKKVIKISKLDIEKHKKFLKTEIKKNYY